MKYPCSLEILFYVTCCLWHPACEGKPIIICTDVLWWYQCRDLQSHSSPCVLTPSCRDKAGTCSLHWAACPELCYAPTSTHCYTWQPITCNARTWNIHLHESPDSDMLWPPSNCAGPSLRALNYSRQPNSSSLEAKPSHTDALEPGKMDAPHTVGQNIPLSRAIDRTNIKDSPLARASLSLSPVCQSTPSWPRDSRSSPHTSGHIKHSEATAAGTWDGTQPDACTYRTCMCTNMGELNTDTDYRWVQGSPDASEVYSAYKYLPCGLVAKQIIDYWNHNLLNLATGTD